MGARSAAATGVLLLMFVLLLWLPPVAAHIHPANHIPTLPLSRLPSLLDNSPANTDFVVVVNGAVCRPCARLYPLLQESGSPLLPPSVLTAEFRGEGLALLKRTENGEPAACRRAVGAATEARRACVCIRAAAAWTSCLGPLFD